MVQRHRAVSRAQHGCAVKTACSVSMAGVGIEKLVRTRWMYGQLQGAGEETAGSGGGQEQG